MPGMIQPAREVYWSHDEQRLLAVKIYSPLTGNAHIMEVQDVEGVENITREQWDRWQAGEHIQTAMPQLTAPEREFLMSGIPPHKWDKYMKDAD
jgi:hypothetical protein